LKIDLHIHLTCEHCGQQSLLDTKGANMHALRAALASISAANRVKPAKGEEQPWAQELLEKLFYWAPFGTWFEANSIPEEKLTPYFTGANPRAQFGLWMTHYSRRPRKEGAWYVKRNKPDESAAEYLVGFQLGAERTYETAPVIYRMKYDTFKESGERI
jgi:hypothetical protein